MQYVRPEIKDYGDLVSITADGAGMAHLGFGTLAAVSSQVLPSADSGDVLPSTDSSGTPEAASGGDAGGVAGDVASGGDSGGSSGGSSGGGAGAGKLPFTGFAAAAVAAIGAGLTGAGAAAKKYLARR